MGVENTSKPSEVLKGLHGVHLSFHSPLAAEGHQCGDFHMLNCGGSEKVQTNYGITIQQIWKQRPMCFRSMHCSLKGDQNIAETVANVLTSLPFIAIGLQTPRKNLNSKLYANSFIGVGVASNLCHCSRGELRKILRWVDYTMIAATTIVSFAKRASMKPELRAAHNLHAIASLFGGALFIADDCFPQTPFIHAAWHLAAAVGTGTCNKLLE